MIKPSTPATAASATPTATATPTTTPSPTPLPGAQLVAFDSNRDGNHEIYLLDTASGELTNLSRDAADDRAPAWSPDGRALAFESHRDGNWEIYVLDLEDGSLLRLTDHPAYDGAPTWNPDGSEIPSWLSKPLAELPTRGRIGFQGKHAGAPIWFRNIKIKLLK